MSEQCKGVTRSGRQCKNVANLVNGYCRLHIDQAPVPRAAPRSTRAEPDRNAGPERPCTCTCSWEDCRGFVFRAVGVLVVVVAVILLVRRMRRSRS